MELFSESDIIHTYPRAEAIADGQLVDVSDVAREAGILYPCAVTAAVWAVYVAWSDADATQHATPQDESGRLWDILWMFRIAARSASAANLEYRFMVVPCDGITRRAVARSLRAICGPGDDASPVITIMMPSES